jgi:2-oxoisovalerate dehydrogenase E1 component
MITGQKKISKDQALHFYRSILLPRLIEERMLKLLRQNKISKWFSGIGQEAVAVGATLATQKDDVILPMHRNLGVFTTRKVPFYPLFCQLFGKTEGFTQGRDRSFHFGTLDHNIVGMISHLAAMMPVADGIALAKKLRNEHAIALSFCGEGASSEGDFHEAINLAAVWQLPVIFLIENNGYALSTPTHEQFVCENLVSRAEGYGIEGMQIDGNNLFEVYDAVQLAREKALQGKPVLIEAMTFRMRGHEEASGTHYVPDVLMRDWQEKDPVQRFEHYLLHEHLITEEIIEKTRKELEASFRPDLKKALESNDPTFNEAEEKSRVYAIAPDSAQIGKNTSQKPETIEKRFIEGIQSALRQAFEEDESYILMGQDVAEYGGVFKITDGFLEQFGRDRIRNTPIIESGALGAALGLAYKGFKPVVEIQFADFISCGFNQIVNNIAKSRYRWSPEVNITIRAPHGAGVGAGPYHSQSVEGWFMQIPGLKVVVPSSVEDAQNLLYSSLMDPNPVLFFEHKKLYRSIRDVVPEKAGYDALGVAKVVQEGHDASIITYGMGVHWARELAESMQESIEIIDLRTLLPLDLQTIRQSIQKTHRALLIQEATLMMGPMAEISAVISEYCFEDLDAPVMRCGALDTPVPFNKNLEEGFLGLAEMKKKLKALLAY